ncbi:hypothetical protein QBZ16_005106 [Prototheca wickerhamii]|uniref:Thiaminase-2/PQQC domain-containing protein n=1 Tax=Prototheca wickerhamii TaxID=3111 RepID=A0AAD9MKS1_PROWI|nr:hypothetical protein QBZ16_005106 [Prototheca wickerhamii]
MTSTRELIDDAGEAWTQATSGPFLTACQDGSITKRAFDTWLFQARVWRGDYHFGREFVRYVGHIMSIAPDDAIGVLLSGMTAMDDELKWFQATLGERGVGLQELTGTCKEYCRFLRAARSDPLAVQMVVLWAVEVAYHESWRKHRPMPEPYHAYADRWASPGFADYVAQLGLLADRALQGQPDEVLAMAREAFAEVCRLEKAFWDMVVTTAE